MSGGRKHALKYPPLNAAGRAWEREQLRAWGLTDIVWDPEVECPWCRAKPLQSGEDDDAPPEASGGPMDRHAAGPGRAPAVTRTDSRGHAVPRRRGDRVIRALVARAGGALRGP